MKAEPLTDWQTESMSTLTDTPEVQQQSYAQLRALAGELELAIVETTDPVTRAELRGVQLDILAASDRAWLAERS